MVDLQDGSANVFTFTEEDVFDFSGTNNADLDPGIHSHNSLVIHADIGDTVNLDVDGASGSWAQNGTVLIDGSNYDLFDFTDGNVQASVAIDPDADWFLI